MSRRSHFVPGLLLALSSAACVPPMPSAEVGGSEGSEGSESSEETETETETETGGQEPQCDADALLYAPPPIDLGVVELEPADVLSVTAQVHIDANASPVRSEVSASMQFRVGPGGGLPLFDLRQELDSARLDGEPVALEDVNFFQLSSSSQALVRVLEVQLEPCSEHVLEFEYELDRPLSEGDALPPPNRRGGAIEWGIYFDDWFGGRYLESWLPAGLSHDRFDLQLGLELDGVDDTQLLLTSGTLTEQGPAKWQVNWSQIAPADPFWYLSTSAEGELLEGLHQTPQGAEIPYQLLVRDLDAESMLALTLAALDEYAEAYGDYPHARLSGVVTSTTRSMEYAGGFTASPEVVVHEVHHQWWGRALRPARGQDGWFDEAWTSYLDPEFDVFPIDPQDSPVQLMPEDPYDVRTPVASYAIGSALFAYLAQERGEDTLRALMRDIYAFHPRRDISTLDLERELYCGLGRDELIRELFHRFVYGQEGEPEPAPDRWCG